MKLSVIIPVYNGQDCILRCLESIIKQTYKDMEIIVVNDGSTDSTKDIIEEFQKKHIDRELTIVNQVNKGNSLARKSGIDIAKGEYVGFVDADDWIEMKYFESLVEVVKNTNADMAVSYTHLDVYKRQLLLVWGLKIKKQCWLLLNISKE